MRLSEDEDPLIIPVLDENTVVTVRRGTSNKTSNRQSRIFSINKQIPPPRSRWTTFSQHPTVSRVTSCITLCCFTCYFLYHIVLFHVLLPVSHCVVSHVISCITLSYFTCYFLYHIVLFHVLLPVSHCVVSRVTSCITLCYFTCYFDLCVSFIAIVFVIAIHTQAGNVSHL